MDEKSRNEMILRAKISYTESSSNTSMRAWIDRELAEIGMQPITDAEFDNYSLSNIPRIFQDV